MGNNSVILELQGRGKGFESLQEKTLKRGRGRSTQASGGHTNDLLAPGPCKVEP